MAYLTEAIRNEAIAWAHGRSSGEVNARIDELCRDAAKLAARVTDDALNTCCAMRSEDVARFGPRQRKAYAMVALALELNAVADAPDRELVTETVGLSELRAGDVIVRDAEAWNVTETRAPLTMPTTVLLRSADGSRRSHVRTATVPRIVPTDRLRELQSQRLRDEIATRPARIAAHELTKLERDGSHVPERMARPLDIAAIGHKCEPFSAAHGPFRCGADADNGRSKLAVHYWSDGNRSGYFCGFHSPYDVERSSATAEGCYDRSTASELADVTVCVAVAMANIADARCECESCQSDRETVASSGAVASFPALPWHWDEDVARILDYGKGFGRSTVEELARHWGMEDYSYASDGDGASFSVVSLDTADVLWLALASLLDTCTSWSGQNFRQHVRDVTADELPRELESWSDVRALGVENDAQGFVYVTSYRGLWAINEAEAARDAWHAAYGDHGEDCDCDREDCAELRAERETEARIADDGLCAAHSLPRDDGHDPACHSHGAAYGDLMGELRYAESLSDAGEDV